MNQTKLIKWTKNGWLNPSKTNQLKLIKWNKERDVEVITLPILESRWYRDRIKNSSFFGWMLLYTLLLMSLLISLMMESFLNSKVCMLRVQTIVLIKLFFFLGLCMMYWLCFGYSVCAHLYCHKEHLREAGT